MDKSELLDIRAAILDALAFLETLRRGPDGEHGNGGIGARARREDGPARHGAASGGGGEAARGVLLMGGPPWRTRST